MAKQEPQGKKGPTPSRREREAANRRPLVPEDRKQAKREMQARMKAQQAEQREGMARGDDRYLRPTDRGPQKRFMRDYIDARFSLGELLLPLMFLVIFVTFVPSQQASVYAMGFIWLYLAIALAEAIIVANIIKKKIAEVVGRERVEKGIMLGTITRILQLRLLRMPKARVKRGEKIEYTGR